MTESKKARDEREARQHASEDRADTVHTVVVPNSVNMVSLLGAGDEHLGLIERALEADIHVRGNKITLRGEPAEIALAERMLEELVTIIRTGQVRASTLRPSIG
jgi:phosphate starvation-inducible PhoH-like protein